MASICDKVISALKEAENHNSELMVRPEVILWPDPENQWVEVIGVLQVTIPHLLIYGPYQPEKKQGPAIWIKSMIAGLLPEARWSADAIPIIYLPGVAKSDLRNVENAVFNFQPLLEYQYTGTLFMQENSREWTILAFLENNTNGLGIRVSKDNATREALRKALPAVFQDREIFASHPVVDANFLNNQIFPDIVPTILRWMCKGEPLPKAMDVKRREVFASLCRTQYEFEPDHRNIKAVAERLGTQRNAWKQVWQHYANAPHKFPELEEFLRLAKPADLGLGMFSIPEESWPQVNQEKEEALAQALAKAAKQEPEKAVQSLRELEAQHGIRRNWVWCELGQAPLAKALEHLVSLGVATRETYSAASPEDLKKYYTDSGYRVDQSMRHALAAVRLEKDKEIITAIIRLFYFPWLEQLTQKFQSLVEREAGIFTGQKALEETAPFVLFVDAFRYELAEEFRNRLTSQHIKVRLDAGWSAIPSLTPTAKPNVSPLATLVAPESEIMEFRPQLKNGKDLLTPVFREALKTQRFHFISGSHEIRADEKCWQEIGDIDTRGHQEQADMVRRVEELFDQITEALDEAFERGVQKIKIVTDHGWLLMPGGLPKTQLHAGLTETRWGRCALIKEGITSSLLHLPWRWNPSIFIAYAPGISFFKANEEYAHGGISVHECLVPTLEIENPNTRNLMAEIKSIKWVNLKCTVITTDVPEGYMVDIRTRYTDARSSIVLSENKKLTGNTIHLLVDDAAEFQAAVIVLMDAEERILDKKPTTVGG